jgi:hypothetical protein
MSLDAFKDYYENDHSKLFEKYLPNPGWVRYVRRYVTPIPNRISGETLDTGFDVIMELWFSDRELFQSLAAGRLFGEEFRAFVAKEEEHFFDRDAIGVCMVEE